MSAEEVEVRSSLHSTVNTGKIKPYFSRLKARKMFPVYSLPSD